MARFGTDHSTFILNALGAMGKRTKKKGREILVQCLNHSHKDDHPSMSIRADGAAFICRSCGYKGNWYMLTQQLGLPPLPGADQPKDEVLENLADLKAMAQHGPMARLLNVREPTRLLPWPGGDFRGFSEKTLRRLNTQIWMDRDIKRVYWPFLLKGRIVGGSGRVHPDYEPKPLDGETTTDYKLRLKDWYRDVHPKYRNVHGAHAKQVLYPYDIYGAIDTIVLVEGQTSAIRLIDAGIDAMAILGVENWSDTKRGLLHTKGIRKVILLFDGDKAGRKATEELLSALRADFSVHAMYLPDGVDPGDMDDLWLNFVRRKFMKLAGKKQA